MSEERIEIAVIGGVAAGASAAATARRSAEDRSIVVFEKSPDISYGACGIPYHIEGLIPDSEDLVAFTPERFKEKKGVEVRTGTEAVSLDPQEKRLTLRKNGSGERYSVTYEKLIIATGARAVAPPVEGLQFGEPVFPVRTLEDARSIHRYVEGSQARRAVILGAGYIGLEMAEALRGRGLEVIVLELMEQPLPGADPEMAEMVRRTLEEQGVALHTSTGVERVESSAGGVRVYAGGSEYPADLFVVAAGIAPEMALAAEAGAELGAGKAIRVNRRMETSLPDVYACGDCAGAPHMVSGEEVYIPLGTTANKQGKIAGRNAAGGREEFTGVLGTMITKAFDTEYAKTGLGEREAQRHFEADAVSIKSRCRAGYYPGAGRIRLKLIFEKGSGRLLGAEAAGCEVKSRIDSLSVAVAEGMSVGRLAEMDLAYAPPFSPVWDPVLVAANVAKKRL
jgi:NADPH-dependent 2,4-dienoyl-CoA reductase/sulfur reductase-like enzyme